jgi:hypothetical protein
MRPIPEAMLRLRKTATILLGFVLFALGRDGTPAVEAGGCRDFEDGWLVPISRVAALLGAVGPSSVDSGLNRGAWITLGQTRLYGMPELPLARLALGGRTGSFHWATAWQHLGRDSFREDQYRLAAGWGRSNCWLLSVGWDRLAISPTMTAGRLVMDARARFELTRRVTFLVTWPLLSDRGWYAGRGQFRWFHLSGTLGLVTWASALDRRASGEPSLQFGLIARATRGVGLGLRGEPATGSLGVTTAWRGRKFLMRSSHLVHPDLGTTHRWSLGWGALNDAW